MQPDPALYAFINQGSLIVDGIDDTEEMKITDVSVIVSSILCFISSKHCRIGQNRSEHLLFRQVGLFQRERSDYITAPRSNFLKLVRKDHHPYTSETSIAVRISSLVFPSPYSC